MDEGCERFGDWVFSGPDTNVDILWDEYPHLVEESKPQPKPPGARRKASR